MIIERATKDDHQMLKDLWKEVFNEEEAFLERFFSTRIRYEHIFVAREEGAIVSALHALPSTYLQQGTEHDCSFIVGAATYAPWRRKGIMGSLLQAVREAYSHPITLFPAVRPFYEANGYFTTSSLLQFPLGAMEETSVQVKPIVFSELNRIHRKAHEQNGALLRDEQGWKFLTDGYETIAVQDGYAFLSEGKAVEAFTLTKEAAVQLLGLLSERQVTAVQTLSTDPLAELLGQETAVPIPMGMSTDQSMRGVYIAEQY
ncbi:MAG: GNAT family N-acetyltransferase [Sphaerochaeta sp.]|nr:GNAT family N-acetyltransferase [Spirochaetia bacterium]